jgi:hypothetical protein
MFSLRTSRDDVLQAGLGRVLRRVPAQSFTYGVESDDCGRNLIGEPGERVTFEGFLTLTASDAEVSGWSLGISITGPDLVLDRDLFARCGNDFKMATVNSPIDLGLLHFSPLPVPAHVVDPDLNDQGTGIVDAIILQVGQSLPQEVTVRVLRYRFTVTVPSTGSRDVVFEYRDGLQGLGEPIDNEFFVDEPRPVTSFEGCVFTVTASSGERFRRGDVDHSGRVSVGDAVSLLLFAFGARPVPCVDAADANDDGVIDGSDAVFTLLYIFALANSSPFPEPFEVAGPDSTIDELGCEVGVPLE